jgi:tryptophan synthase alpha subunit
VLAMVAEFRNQHQTPVVLMGYLNPVFVMGYAAFAAAAREAGVDGVLTLDCPPEEAADLSAALIAADLDPVFLIALPRLSTGARNRPSRTWLCLLCVAQRRHRCRKSGH